jgi:hypothetical protein
VLVAVLLAACGARHGSKLGAERHLESAAGAPGRASTPVAASAGPLVPGEYYTSLFGPTFTYTVGDGWRLTAETPGVVVLQQDVGTEREGLTITISSPARSDTVVLRDPITPPGETDDEQLRRSLPMPEDYIAYLAQHQVLGVSDVAPATLLGRPGTVADVAVTDQPAPFCSATMSCLALLLERRPAVAPHGFYAGELERVWDLGGGRDRLIVMVRVAPALADSFEQLVPGALGVLDTVNFA